jgi:hypothetical protein
MSNVINQIKTLLGMEVKLAQMALENGTIIEAEVFEAGASVFIVNEEDRIALPVGEYKLEDGMILIVAEEGIIAEIKEAEAEVVEEVTPEEEVEVEVEQEMSEVKEPKRVIESVTKEMFFAEIESLKKEIEELKLAKTEVKVEEVELSAEPLTHNPEATTKRELNTYSQNRTRTTFDSVLNKISNFK